MSRLELIRASAGTGKTETLSRLVLGALVPSLAETPSQDPPLALTGIIAVTYTNKAAGELRSRLRRTLAKHGRHDEAQQLPLAYVGTVHAVCKRLLDEFSIAAGLPPGLEVLPESLAGRALSEALETALSSEERATFERVVTALRPNPDQMFGTLNWQGHAKSVLELARSNRIRPSELAAMAERSLAAYLPIACTRAIDGAALESRLQRAVTKALSAIGDGDDTDTTAKALTKLRGCDRVTKRGGVLPWADWKSLQDIKAGAEVNELLDDVRAVAEEHRGHPRLREDLVDYTTLLYRAAAQGLASYASWKEERRYIDYTDMEERALDLLESPEVHDILKTRLSLLVVDEFQDTSPIQLALFTKLAELAERAVWVGDRKQSIYAFRGADPALMDAVIESHALAGGKAPETLGTSYRSRRSLVAFASELFTRSLEKDGYDEKEVSIEAKREVDEPGLEKLPPLGVWSLEAAKQEDETLAVAEGIRRLLSTPEETSVVDRASNEVRPLRAADIAVLTVTNDEATALALALGERGIPAIVPRAGLLETPVGTLLSAALRLVVDASDDAAQAIVSALQGFDGQKPDVWLDGLVKAHRVRKAALEANEKLPPRAHVLGAYGALSPTECMDALVAHLGVAKLATRWPQPELARANIEAFRAMAQGYEDEVRAERRGGSLVGFLRYLDEAAEEQQDLQHAGGADAVQITTYHAAKGLEWPVVILWSLDQKARGYGPTPTTTAQRLEGGGGSAHFRPVLETDAQKFDARKPLEGRWIRFYPWPYGGAKTGPTMDAVAGTSEGRAQIASSAREALRLLYVGITRARDHLIFALFAKVTKKGGGAMDTSWLDTLHDGTSPLLQMPDRAKEDDVVRIGKGTATRARVWRLTPGTRPPARLSQASSRSWFREGARQERSGFYIAPSRADVEWPTSAKWQLEVHELGGTLRMDLSGKQMADVGTAVHAFFAADPMDASMAERLVVAGRILTGEHADLTSAEELVAAHDRLRAYLERVMPGGTWRREVPVAAHVGDKQGRRHVRGAIDLLVESADRALIVDHKAFPGGRELALEKARGYAGQLSAYARVVGKARWG